MLEEVLLDCVFSVFKQKAVRILGLWLKVYNVFICHRPPMIS